MGEGAIKVVSAGLGVDGCRHVDQKLLVCGSCAKEFPQIRALGELQAGLQKAGGGQAVPSNGINCLRSLKVCELTYDAEGNINTIDGID